MKILSKSNFKIKKAKKLKASVFSFLFVRDIIFIETLI